MKIESKVLIPAVAGFIAAVLTLLAAFGLDLTQDQQSAILGTAVAGLVALQAVLGYLSPHTDRPDLHGAATGRHGIDVSADDGESPVILILAVVGVVAVILFVVSRL